MAATRSEAEEAELKLAHDFKKRQIILQKSEQLPKSASWMLVDARYVPRLMNVGLIELHSMPASLYELISEGHRGKNLCVLVTFLCTTPRRYAALTRATHNRAAQMRFLVHFIRPTVC